MDQKIAFYLMNKKGFYIFDKFVKKFSSSSIEYVVSSVDKNIQKDYFKEIKQLCKQHKIDFFDKNSDYLIKEKSFTGYKFAIGWRWIIVNSTNLIVFHDSLLPKYRGFAPLVNSLVSNEKLVGVTALFANNEYDKGDIIMQRSMRIKYPIKIDKLLDNIKPLYYDLVEDIYSLLLQGKQLPRRKQDESKATYSVWLNSEDYFIDWKNWSARKIKRFVDATSYPYDNAKAYLNVKVVKFIDVEVVDDVKVKNRKRHIGKVIFIEDKPIIVCKKGLLKLVDIREENGSKLMITFRSKFK